MRWSFHKDHDHTIEQCNSLHYLVEKLIKVGNLKQYVRIVGWQRETVQEAAVQASASPTTPRVVINYIHEGLIDDIHSSKRKRQRLLRVAFIKERVNSVQSNFSEGSMRPTGDIVTFSLVGANQVLQPYEDALALTLGVGKFDVRRVLVDQGSSIDLLQILVFKKMGYSPSALKHPGHLLFGFNGATTSSLGDVVLPVQASPVILNIQFSMVDDLSPYNAIMGHAWLHRMKTILATYH